MANIHDYLLWRGDLELSREPFQDVDALALCCLAYYSFHNIVEPQSPHFYTIAEVAERAANLPSHQRRMRVKEDYEILSLMGAVKRFQNMNLHYYVDYKDLDREEQFSAITIDMGNGDLFVSFRGTDSTLVGWKEDLNMTFLEQVPAQNSAMEYLRLMAKHHGGRIYVGGQSKGGNLAVYAAAHVPEDVQKRIVAVYNFDGPGFHRSVIEKDGFQKIVPKIRTFVPQSSIIGKFLEHAGEYTVIYSRNKGGILQHDPYSWEIMRNDFIRSDEETEDAKKFNENLKYWLEKLSMEQREKLIDSVYDLISKSPINEQGYLIFSTRGIAEATQTFRDESEEVKNTLSEGFRMIIGGLEGYKDAVIEKVSGMIGNENANE